MCMVVVGLDDEVGINVVDDDVLCVVGLLWFKVCYLCGVV